MEQLNTAQQNDLATTLIKLDETKKSSEKSQKRLEEAMERANKHLEEAMEKVNKQNEQWAQNQVKKEEPQTALTIKELEALGGKLSSIIKQITITNYGIDATMMMREVDPAYYVFSLRRLMGAIFEQNQFLIEELATISFILSMNGSREDIEAVLK